MLYDGKFAIGFLSAVIVMAFVYIGINEATAIGEFLLGAAQVLSGLGAGFAAIMAWRSTQITQQIALHSERATLRASAAALSKSSETKAQRAGRLARWIKDKLGYMDANDLHSARKPLIDGIKSDCASYSNISYRAGLLYKASFSMPSLEGLEALRDQLISLRAVLATIDQSLENRLSDASLAGKMPEEAIPADRDPRLVPTT